MALPPIISNFPLFKIFRPGGNAASPRPTDASSRVPFSNPAQDIVQISEAARQKIEGLQQLNVSQVRALTAEVRQALEQNPISLGLNPDFAG
jgi:hypothetical protein